MLSGLGAAHAIGIVHRDVKPQNLFLHQTPVERSRLKVMDFGVARVFAPLSERTPRPLLVSTESGSIVGSHYFMSPEGARGERVDHRADVYSAGLIFYLMLVGHGPTSCLSPSAGPSREAEPPSAHVGPAISAELDAVALRAIRLEPLQRYQSTQDFEAALARLGSQGHTTPSR